MDKRNRWINKDLELLKKVYQNSNTVGGIGGEIKYPTELLKRHSTNSCQKKATTLRITTNFIERKIFIETWPDFDIGYFAGIVDGEGCIDITKGNRKNGKSYFTSRLHIVNTDINLMEWLKERIGMGSYYREHRERDNHKKCYTFVISAVNDLLGILKAIEPYLVIKKEKAQEIIKLLEDRIEWRKHLRRNYSQ